MCFYPEGVLQKRAEAASQIESDSNSNEGFRLKMDFISTFRTIVYNSFLMIRRELPVHSIITCSPPTSRYVWTLNSWRPSWANRRQSIMGPHPSTYPSAQTQSLTHQRSLKVGEKNIVQRKDSGVGEGSFNTGQCLKWGTQQTDKTAEGTQTDEEELLLITTCSSRGGPGGRNTSADTEENFLAALVTTSDHNKAVQERFQTSFTQAPEQKRHKQSSLHHHGDQTKEVRRRNRSVVFRIYSIGTCSPFGTCWEAWCSMTWWVPGWPSMWPLTSGESLNSDLLDLVRAVLMLRSEEDLNLFTSAWSVLSVNTLSNLQRSTQTATVCQTFIGHVDWSFCCSETTGDQIQEAERSAQVSAETPVLSGVSLYSSMKDNLWWGISSDLLLKMSQIQMKTVLLQPFSALSPGPSPWAGNASLQSQLWPPWTKSRILC